MKAIRVLLCDDDARNRRDFREDIEREWRKLGPQPLSISCCDDIVEGDTATDFTFTIGDASAFNVILLDISWPRGKKREPHGVEICRRLRKECPELPIVVFSEHVTVDDFRELIPIGIDGYIPKRPINAVAWCLELKRVLERVQLDTGGQALYQRIRELLKKGDAWNASVINRAATEVWRFGNSQEKWRAFWASMRSATVGNKLTSAFDELAKHFSGTDLLTLAASRSMRGHLEHVIYVYFTGYVISHSVDDFREWVTKASQKLLGNKFKKRNAELYWELFQFAWMAAATLHDTGYALELLPDLETRCNEVAERFNCLRGNVEARVNFEALDVGEIDWKKAAKTRDIFVRICNALHPNWDGHWIEKHSSFKMRGAKRINHGVASAVLFVDRAEKLLELPGQVEELRKFLEWAATAMALHSLKRPGSEQRLQLRPNEDPLSFLLMLCDELQIWDRERTDETPACNDFKAVRLSTFDVTATQVDAEMLYVPWNPEVAPETIRKMDLRAVEDNQILNGYMDVSPLSVRIKARIQGLDESLPAVELGTKISDSDGVKARGRDTRGKLQRRGPNDRRGSNR
jgi:CheY-like chemotaxis protein